VTSANGCTAISGDLPYYSYLNVLPHSPSIPSDAFIVQGSDTGNQRTEAKVWVCPGGSYNTGTGSAQTIYVESGGNVTLGSSRDHTIYLRVGASLVGGGGGGDHIAIYESGAGMTNFANVRVVQTDSVRFDYTSAPNGGCPSLASYTIQIKHDITAIRSPWNGSGSGKQFLVEDEGMLEITGDSNTFYVESGGTVIATGNVNRIYLKKGATFESKSGSDNRIFYELDATISNPGANPNLFPSSGITFVRTGTGVVTPAMPGPSQELTIWPNPARNSASISYMLEQPGILQISIYNAAGERVSGFETAPGTPGEQTIAVQTESLIEGIYTVVVSDGERQSATKLSIVR
jgi:hypothetical protein